jgi:hypothetical protein
VVFDVTLLVFLSCVLQRFAQVELTRLLTEDAPVPSFWGVHGGKGDATCVSAISVDAQLEMLGGAAAREMTAAWDLESPLQNARVRFLSAS